MIEWLFTFLIAYLVYKLVFDFIIPVAKASKQMRDKINQMHQPQQQQTQYQQKSADTNTRPPAEDYIEFEEIK